MPSSSKPLKPTAVRALGKCCRGDLGGEKKNTCCMCNSGREGEGDGEKQKVRETARERESQGGGWVTAVSVEEECP